MRIAPDTSLVDVAAPRHSARRHLVGVSYACACLVVGVCFNSLAHVYLETSPFWPSFQSQYTAPWLAAQLRSHLVLGPTWPDLDVTAVGVAASDAMGTPPAYARQLMYDDLTSLEAAIAGLWRLESSHLSMILSGYCWADLQRRWALGHTARRQARCETAYVANAAVYLEAILRNVADVQAWNDVARFESTIALPIASTFEDGAAWVDSVYAHARAPSIEEEARVWRAHGCRTFVLQWANRIQVGVFETIQLRNALGMRQPFTLHALPSTLMSMAWTSLYLFAGLFNDFNALAAGNLSLVRTTPTFFGLSQPDLIEDFNAGLPLPILYQVLHDRIGPLGSIDLYWVSVPASVAEAVAAFRAETDMLPMPSLTLRPTPLHWQDPALRFHGGNPMCMMGNPLPYVREAFGFDDACASLAPVTITLDPLNSLFGLWMTQTPDAACSSVLDTTDGRACVAFLQSLAPSLRRLPPVHADLDAVFAHLNLSLLQYVDFNHTITLDLQPLLGQSWAFFGWTMVYDWAMRRREVVSFQGDEGSMHLLSAEYAPIPNANTISTPTAWVYYVSVSNWAFSAGLIAVFCLCLRYDCCQQSSATWWRFPRLVSSVYLNRGLVSLRSLIAIVCLATAPVVPRAEDGATALVFEPRSVVASSILAIEATWVLYCVYDMLHPILSHRTNTRAACSAGAAVLTLLAIDQFAPVHVLTQLRRSCDSVNMDTMIYCTSGVVAIGDASRSLVLGLVLLASVVLGSMLPLSGRADVRCIPNLAVPLALVSYQDPTLRNSTFLDPATAAMSGLFRLSPATVFDIKLWRPLPLADDVQVRGTLLPHCSSLQPVDCCMQELGVPVTWRRCERISLLLCGLGFLTTSLVGNVLYLQRAEMYLANDYGWADFNSTGARTWLGNLFNEALLSTNSASNILVDGTSNGTIAQHYNGSSTVLLWADGMARRAHYRHDTPLAEIIVGLRAMDPCVLPWMFTQYCYLDFDGAWEMALTSMRQTRCLRQRSNGAVFLESALRNINDWGAWDRCWGNSFEVAIQRPLATTTRGQQWLQALKTRRNSVEHEVASWASHRVTHFVLQWQNYKTTGLVDSLTITSALGLAYDLRLSESRGVLHLERQTSRKMYWSFASDLWAVASNATAIAGASLVRASANFAFLNTTSEALLLANSTLPTPLPSGLQVVRDALGPFNAIDMLYIPCPPALQAFYREATAHITAVLLTNLRAQAAFAAIPLANHTLPVPQRVESLDLLTYGGNLLCGDDLPNYPLASGFYCFFGSHNMCHAYYNEYIPLTTIELLLSLLAAPTLLAVNATALCLNDALASSTCSSMYISAMAFLQAHVPGTVEANDALADVLALELKLIQFVSPANDSSQITLLRLPLAENTWRIDTWLYLVQWAAGARDVVSFQGDAGALTTISTVSSPQSMTPDPNEIPNTISFLFLTAVRYVTATLIAVALVAAIVAVRDNAYVNGLNLFELNRVVGHVWIGRSWLLSRSVSALWLLNTSTLSLESYGAGTKFESPPLHWATTFLAGGESTWFVYILNDLWSCVTRQWTAYYAYKSALLAWAATSLYVTIAPVQYVASIHRSCNYIEMDLGLRCVSASVHIGSATRVAFGFGLGALAVLVCFGVERWRLRHLPPMTLCTTLLNATSLHMLITSKDLLDRPSAVLAGVFALRNRDHLYLFDIKSWRFLALPVDAASRSAGCLIPLNRV
ncbi:hypothetical protein SDRG_06845 [Saprolegnia diclina VS20]|uniref:Uncharacterized protein n=1 Tax=Saprolegnia diclina (strain VS20) TaxID=1156394 RepID=T0QNZ1_SAPDV|nr:hypothetical protein SDRG_06845 [Saprolegnia diclina VS20]EQC35555.1 hypothetical protein SDRG_06845 [Saprolegnia diclina VS20]|eukprot:XP_008610872.1 hypothetical protein SDRG_06845 [Saprolegnia diclina VS20]